MQICNMHIQICEMHMVISEKLTLPEGILYYKQLPHKEVHD